MAIQLAAALAVAQVGLSLYQGYQNNKSANASGRLANRSFELQRSQNRAAALTALLDRSRVGRELDALLNVSFTERGFDLDSASARRFKATNERRTNTDLRTIRDNASAAGMQLANQFAVRQNQIDATRRNLGFSLLQGGLQGFTAGVQLENALLMRNYYKTGLSTGQGNGVAT